MRSLLKPFNKLRHGFCRLTYRDYVKKKVALRKGRCKKCGKCCKGCRHLDKKTNLCLIYNKRPRFLCYKNFPLDNIDKWIWKVEDCGYWFEE